MFESNRILALDIGAGNLVLAEFAVAKGGGPELLSYGIGGLDAGATGEADASAYIVSAIRQLMREQNIRPAPLYMTISGQTVFPRFVKLPPVAKDKVLEIIRYEAEQNVPFPIEEVVWDYELLRSGDAEQEELNVMLVAVKTDKVTSLTDCVVAAGLEPEIVDVAPMALYNAVRFNYPSLQGCTMILDVGARSSNLIFMEEERIFSRSIPVAGNSITQEIVKEFGVGFDEAEALKKEHAFVAFGGVYAGPDDAVSDRVSKVVRNVITRLHAEVNRSINFYRSQQGGSPPSFVLLAGGSSRIPHMDTFFREKLNVGVEYLNPFAAVPVSPNIATERIEADACLLGEVVGMAIRRTMSCPIEINLMPPDLLAKKAFRRRVPFFAASAIGLILIMLCWWVYFQRMRSVSEDRVRKIDLQLAIREADDGELNAALNAQKESEMRFDAIVTLVERRASWVRWIDEIHSNLLDGMWLRSVSSVMREGRQFIEISGSGFVDQLKQHENEAQQLTAVDVFRDKLRASPQFSDETGITAVPVPPPGAFARDFTILVAVEEAPRKGLQ